MFQKDNQLWKLKKNFKHSEETKRKLSKIWKKNNDYRIKFGFQKGHEINLGKHWKMSKSARENLSRIRKGKHYSLRTEFKKGIKLRPETIEKMKGRIPWNKNRKLSEIHKMKLSKSKKGKHYPNVSLAKKLQWQNPDYREKTIRNQLRGLLKRPTSLERKFMEFCKEFNLPYKYVGDGSFLIGFKNPDFVDKTRKICIEVANRVKVHHPDGYAESRIEHFKKYGWNCLVLFEEDLNSKNEVLKKLTDNGLFT